MKLIDAASTMIKRHTGYMANVLVISLFVRKQPSSPEYRLFCKHRDCVHCDLALADLAPN